MATPAVTSLGEVLVEVWRQVLVDGREEIERAGRSERVGRTRSQGLRTIAFRVGEFAFEGIEQNPEKPSRWGQLARDGQRIMQFRSGGRYVANVCEGRLTRYPMWRSKGLPE